MLRYTLLLLALTSGIQANSAVPFKDYAKKPKLVLVIVFDQLRSDFLSRHQDKFLPAMDKNGNPGGFRYLMEKGAYYPQAEYGLLQAMTGPGHATILSGSYPYKSGIPINDWFNPKTKEEVYCAEDPNYKTVGAKNDDPHVGTAPTNFRGSTLGDEMKNAENPGKVVTLAIKDRAAILMAGYRADVAVWMDQKSVKWVSSTFYLKDGKLPTWLGDLNKKLETSKVKESDLNTQTGLQITTDAAIAAFRQFEFGKSKGTDLFAVSYSTHDYAGHRHGPTSKIMDTMTLADDQAVSKLLNVVKSSVPGGLKDVVVVLTADHGVASDPDLLNPGNLPSGRFDENSLKDELEKYLDKEVGSEEWLLAVAELNFYFSEKVLANSEKRMKAYAAAKQFLMTQPMVENVLTDVEIERGTVPGGLLKTQVLRTYYPGRSGNLIVVPRSNYFSGKYKVSHMTGYAYDRTVPIAFVGQAFKAGVYSEKSDVVDIAPTLAFLLGVVPPSLSEGRVLSESIGAGK